MHCLRLYQGSSDQHSLLVLEIEFISHSFYFCSFPELHAVAPLSSFNNLFYNNTSEAHQLKWGKESTELIIEAYFSSHFRDLHAVSVTTNVTQPNFDNSGVCLIREQGILLWNEISITFSPATFLALCSESSWHINC